MEDDRAGEGQAEPGSLTPAGLARPGRRKGLRSKARQNITAAIGRQAGKPRAKNGLRPEQRAKLRAWLEKHGVEGF